MTKLKILKNLIFMLCIIFILAICCYIQFNWDEGVNVVAATAVVTPEAESQVLSSMQEESLSVGQESEPAVLDDKLLILVNGKEALPEDYQITPRLYGEVIVDIKIYDQLVNLINAAGEEKLTLWLASGYRSVEEQQTLYDNAVEDNLALGMSRKEAKAEASRTIADPGHSEHHTGLAVDFNTVSEEFRETPEYTWLQEHAHEYGFIQRYSADKEEITGIAEEVWHYRYVGVEHATRMKELNMCLEEYCEYLLE